MPRLLIKSPEVPAHSFELRLGTNRLGRSAQNDFPIDHVTISAVHCEIVVRDGLVLVRDCNSTNGTFIDGEPVKEARLEAGQTLHLGSVEMTLDTSEIKIAIPELTGPAQPEAPRLLPDGSVSCRKHPETAARYRCKQCKEMVCDTCVRRMKRVGGQPVLLCPLCSHPCEPLGPARKKRRSLLEILRKTLKLPPKAGHHPER